MQDITVTLELAYAEACQALGEEIVKSRLMARAVAQEEADEAGRQMADTAAADPGDASGNGHGDIGGGTAATKLTEVGAANANDPDHQQGGLQGNKQLPSKAAQS